MEILHENEIVLSQGRGEGGRSRATPWIPSGSTTGMCDLLNLLFFFLSLYTARPSFEYYRQVYFVHSRLQDESLQVAISKLP